MVVVVIQDAVMEGICRDISQRAFAVAIVIKACRVV